MTGPNGNSNVGDDGITQQSLLYQVYNANPLFVGPHIVIFNGAMGAQSLDKWDPTPNGWYANNNDCTTDGANGIDPECNYIRVRNQLVVNGFSEAQVQAVFMKSATSYPQCDMRLLYNCPQNGGEANSDAYASEKYMGDILRYLKCCKLGPPGAPPAPRYPNLQQVFITTRTYGGYAANSTAAGGLTAGCLSPEPFAYEEGFAVQRAVVAQIDGNTTDYAGDVRYPQSAPWFDWGPYLWANGANRSSNGLFWCDTTTQGLPQCLNNQGDFRYGDTASGFTEWWGDHTHPTYQAQKKVADQIVSFIKGTLQGPQAFISDWVTPWVLTK